MQISMSFSSKVCEQHICSCGEQIRDARYKRYHTSIHNLLSRLPSGWYMLSIGISFWTGLDRFGPGRGYLRRRLRCSSQQELSKSQISWL